MSDEIDDLFSDPVEKPAKAGEDFSSLVLPWGRFKGSELRSVPNYYVKWLAENSRNEEIAKAADSELKYREKWDINVAG